MIATQMEYPRVAPGRTAGVMPGTGSAGSAARRWHANGETAAFAGFLVGRANLDGPLLRTAAGRDAGHPADGHLLFLLCLQETRYRLDDELVVAATGDILCLDLAQADRTAFEATTATVLAIARSLVRLAPTVLDVCHGTRIDGSRPLGQLFAGQMTLLARMGPMLAPAEGNALAQSIGTLAATLLAESKPVPAAEVLDTPLAAILTFIERNLARTDLSPTLICRQFGLSRSALYRLFEPIGGIAACIRERRLECARRHLTAAGEGRGSVARLALSVGFPSDAAFARAFRSRYGVVPSAALLAGASARAGAGSGHWRRT